MPPANPAPVPFVMGVARSGTTLLRLMLDAHPDLAIPAETGILHLLAPWCADPVEDERRLRARFFETLRRSPGWPDLDTTDDELADTLADVVPFTIADGVRAFFGRYAAARGKRRWGEKTPGHLLELELLFELLPEARALHVIRDGRDVAVSVRPLWFRPGNTIQELAASWRSQVEKARRAGEGTAAYLEIRYEQLISDPEVQLRRICEVLELPFDRQMLAYYRIAHRRLDELRDRYDDEGALVISKKDRLHNHRFTSRPPTTERVGRWREELSPTEQAVFEEAAGDLLEDLGYPTGSRA